MPPEMPWRQHSARVESHSRGRRRPRCRRAACRPMWNAGTRANRPCRAVPRPRDRCRRRRSRRVLVRCHGSAPRRRPIERHPPQRSSPAGEVFQLSPWPTAPPAWRSPIDWQAIHAPARRRRTNAGPRCHRRGLLKTSPRRGPRGLPGRAPLPACRPGSPAWTSRSGRDSWPATGVRPGRWRSRPPRGVPARHRFSVDRPPRARRQLPRTSKARHGRRRSPPRSDRLPDRSGPACRVQPPSREALRAALPDPGHRRHPHRPRRGRFLPPPAGCQTRQSQRATRCPLWWRRERTPAVARLDPERLFH